MGQVKLLGRVSFFKKYGILKCFTIEVNICHSLKILELPAKVKFDPNKHLGLNIKAIEALEKGIPKSVNDQAIFNRIIIQKIGKSILKSVGDYYEMIADSRVYGSPFINHDNFKSSITLDLSLKFPYRFYPNIQSFYAKGKKCSLISRYTNVHQRVYV